MKEQITHNFTYNPNTFSANAREYDLKAALREDWYITRRNIRDSIDNVKSTIETSITALLSVPIVAYAVPKMIIDVNRRILSRNRTLRLGAL